MKRLIIFLLIFINIKAAEIQKPSLECPGFSLKSDVKEYIMNSLKYLKDSQYLALDKKDFSDLVINILNDNADYVQKELSDKQIKNFDKYEIEVFALDCQGCEEIDIAKLLNEKLVKLRANK